MPPGWNMVTYVDYNMNIACISEKCLMTVSCVYNNTLLQLCVLAKNVTNSITNKFWSVVWYHLILFVIPT